MNVDGGGGLNSSSLNIAQHSSPAFITSTFPGFNADSVFTSRIGNTGFAIGPSPAQSAPTFARFITKSSGLVTTLAANRFVAEMTFPTVFTYTFHGFSAISVFAAWESGTNVTIFTRPSWMAAVKG